MNETLSAEIIEEFTKKKEAFIMNELQPYIEDGKLIQKVNIRLAEIQDYKNVANNKFKEFIKRVDERILDLGILEINKDLNVSQVISLALEIIKEEAGDKLIEKEINLTPTEKLNKLKKMGKLN